MRFSLQSVLVLTLPLVAVGAGMLGGIIALDGSGRADLWWFLGAVGLIGGIMATGTAIGWMAAWRTTLLPFNLWPGLVFSIPSWGLFALLRYSLYLTSQWSYDQEKVGGLLALERLAAHHLFDYLAVGMQLAIIWSLRSKGQEAPVVVGSAVLIFWISVVCLALWLCAASGIYYGSLR
jgi:hypothetical protein